MEERNKLSEPKAIDYEIDINTGCFNVTSHSKAGKGYPRMERNGKRVYLHRFIWERCFGEIPKGMCVCHKCDNPNCINPEHLWLGSRRENAISMIRTGRLKFVYEPKRQGRSLTDEEILLLRRKCHQIPELRPTVEELAKEFNTTKTRIINALGNHRWLVLTKRIICLYFL